MYPSSDLCKNKTCLLSYVIRSHLWVESMGAVHFRPLPETDRGWCFLLFFIFLIRFLFLTSIPTFSGDKFFLSFLFFFNGIFRVPLQWDIQLHFKDVPGSQTKFLGWSSSSQTWLMSFQAGRHFLLFVFSSHIRTFLVTGRLLL